MLTLIALQLSSFFESFFLFNKSVAQLSEAQEKVLHGLFLVLRIFMRRCKSASIVSSPV